MRVEGVTLKMRDEGEIIKKKLEGIRGREENSAES